MKIPPSSEVSLSNSRFQQFELRSRAFKINHYIFSYGTFLSFIANVIVAYISMYERNKNMAVHYFIYVTPNPKFFKIWIFIYLSVLLCVIHNLWKGLWKDRSCFIFICSNCVFMIHSWIWSFDTVSTIVIAGFILALIDVLLICFWRTLQDQYQATKISQNEQKQGNQEFSIQNQQDDQIIENTKGTKKYSEIELFIVRNIFSLYIGWTTVAGTIILGIACVYLLGLSLCEQFLAFWITTPFAAVAIYVFMAFKQPKQYKYCFGYILALVWGFIGAGSASIQHITEKQFC